MDRSLRIIKRVQKIKKNIIQIFIAFDLIESSRNNKRNNSDKKTHGHFFRRNT